MGRCRLGASQYFVLPNQSYIVQTTLNIDIDNIVIFWNNSKDTSVMLTCNNGRMDDVKNQFERLDLLQAVPLYRNC